VQLTYAQPIVLAWDFLLYRSRKILWRSSSALTV